MVLAQSRILRDLVLNYQPWETVTQLVNFSSTHQGNKDVILEDKFRALKMGHFMLCALVAWLGPDPSIWDAGT